MEVLGWSAIRVLEIRERAGDLRPKKKKKIYSEGRKEEKKKKKKKFNKRCTNGVSD